MDNNAYKIIHDLNTVCEWLNSKGYSSESLACLKAIEFIEKINKELSNLNSWAEARAKVLEELAIVTIERDALQSQLTVLREKLNLITQQTLLEIIPALAAAISLLERSPKTGAPSNKMFDLMLNDYKKSLEKGRINLMSALELSEKKDGE